MLFYMILMKKIDFIELVIAKKIKIYCRKKSINYWTFFVKMFDKIFC